MFNTVNRYSIRKLTIGVASICIGLSFVSHNQTVHADAVENSSSTNKINTQDPSAEVKTEPSIVSANEKDKSAKSSEQTNYDRESKDLGHPETITNLPDGVTYNTKGHHQFYKQQSSSEEKFKAKGIDINEVYDKIKEIVAPDLKRQNNVLSKKFTQTIKYLNAETGTSVFDDSVIDMHHEVRRISVDSAIFEPDGKINAYLMQSIYNFYVAKGKDSKNQVQDWRVLKLAIDPFSGKVIRQDTNLEEDGLRDEDYKFLATLPSYTFASRDIPQIEGYETAYSLTNDVNNAIKGTKLPSQQTKDQDVQYYVFYIKKAAPEVPVTPTPDLDAPSTESSEPSTVIKPEVSKDEAQPDAPTTKSDEKTNLVVEEKKRESKRKVQEIETVKRKSNLFKTNTKTVNVTGNAELPQAGEKSDIAAIILAMVGLLSSLGLFIFSKKRDSFAKKEE